MKKIPKLNPLLEISLILAITLAALTFFSFSSENFKLLSFELKKPAIKEFLTAQAAKPLNKKIANEISADSLVSDSIKLASNKISEPERKMDSSSHRILMVGESMIEGLMFPFKKYAKENNHKILTKIWYGSRFVDWAKDDTLKKVIDAFKPTYIMISVGSNELYIRKIAERDTFVKNIVQQLGDHKFIWIGPPIPKTDYGITKIIVDNVGEDRYFESKHLTFKRKKDGVHPKPESSVIWADSIAVWIMEKSRYPILLQHPDSVQKQEIAGNVEMLKD